jgi:hypothetical protein
MRSWLATVGIAVLCASVLSWAAEKHSAGRILIVKSTGTLTLFNHGQVLKTYKASAEVFRSNGITLPALRSCSSPPMSSRVYSSRLGAAKHQPVPPLWFTRRVREPAHRFDPGVAVAIEGAVVISAIDEVYPELRLADCCLRPPASWSKQTHGTACCPREVYLASNP